MLDPALAISSEVLSAWSVAAERIECRIACRHVRCGRPMRAVAEVLSSDPGLGRPRIATTKRSLVVDGVTQVLYLLSGARTSLIDAHNGRCSVSRISDALVRSKKICQRAVEN